MINSKTKFRKGFTLLEVILAIFVLTVATAGSSILVRQTISSIFIIQSKLTASYLAQEGIEITRNIRDSNWLEQRTETVSWDDGLGEDQWEAAYNDDELQENSNSFLNISNGFYSYSVGNPTIFKRKITISDKENLDGDEKIDRLMVSVEVSWEERGRSHKVEVIEYLYNWDGYE